MTGGNEELLPIPAFVDICARAMGQWFLYWVPVTALLLVPTLLAVIAEFVGASLPYITQGIDIGIALVSYVVGCGVIAIAMGYADARASVTSAFRAAMTLALPLLWIAVIRGLVVFGGFGLLIVPGVYFLIALMFAQLVMVQEGKRGIAALVESWRIFRARPFQITGKLFLFIVGVVAITLMWAWVTESLSVLVARILTHIVVSLVMVPAGLFFAATLYASARTYPSVVGDSALQAWQLKRLALLGIVVFIALSFFVPYALVEYAPDWLKNTTLRFNPPLLAL